MPLLDDLVDQDKRLERHDLVRQDGQDSKRIPYRERRMVVPGIEHAFCWEELHHGKRSDSAMMHDVTASTV